MSIQEDGATECLQPAGMVGVREPGRIKWNLSPAGVPVGTFQLAWPSALRLALGIVLLTLLCFTWFGNSPATSSNSPSDWSSAIADAGVKNDLNASKTTGAPQQSVVNGWYANDMAVIQTSQNSYIASSSVRNGGLLGILVMGISGEVIIRGLTNGIKRRATAAEPLAASV